MKINVLMLGDVVGKPGVTAVSRLLPPFKAAENIRFVVANGENAAGSGSGITPKEAQALCRAGVDCITLGDHVWKKMEVLPLLEKGDVVLRPFNYPKEAMGGGARQFTTPEGFSFGVVNLQGRHLMHTSVDCPFRSADRALAELGTARVVLVDFHAEATSEKVALGRYLDGRASVVAGTHTHIQTADETVLPGGTAYITDLGMTGPYDSVLGRVTERVLHRMRTTMYTRFDVATGDVRMSGVLVGLDPVTGKASSIRRIQVKLEGD